MLVATVMVTGTDRPDGADGPDTEAFNEADEVAPGGTEPVVGTEPAVP